MADDVVIPATGSNPVATDEVGGRHFQRIKLTDSTAESTDPTGVPGHPLSVTDRQQVAVTIPITGPGLGVTAMDIDCRGYQWAVLRVVSVPDPSQVFWCYGAGYAAGDTAVYYLHALPIFAPNLNNDSPFVGSGEFDVDSASYGYLTPPPPFLYIEGYNSTSDTSPVEAYLDLYVTPSPGAAQVDLGAPLIKLDSISGADADAKGLIANFTGATPNFGRLTVTPSTAAHRLLLDVTTAGAGDTFNWNQVFDTHVIQVFYTGAPSALVVKLQGEVYADAGVFEDLVVFDKAIHASGQILRVTGKSATAFRANVTTLTGGTSPTVTVVWAGTTGGSTPALLDNTPFADGSTPVVPGGFIFDEVAGTALTENDIAAARIDSKRAQATVIEDATTRGQRAAVSAAGALRVDPVGTTTQPVSDAGGSLTVDGTVAVSGTAAVSAASLPLPTGAATAAKQPALGTAGSSSTDVLSVQGIASGTALPVSAASLPLPSGASTAAKQPALGTAGTASADVLTIQGVASMVALLIQGGAATDAAVSGNPLLNGGRASAAAPTAMSADGDAVPFWTDRRGALNTIPGAAGGSTTSGATSSATSASILSANTSRKGVSIHNNSTATLYIKYGGTASIASGGYGVPIGPGVYWEMPSPIDQEAIHGIWSAANGYANIVELT